MLVEGRGFGSARVERSEKWTTISILHKWGRMAIRPETVTDRTEESQWKGDSDEDANLTFTGLAVGYEDTRMLLKYELPDHTFDL